MYVFRWFWSTAIIANKNVLKTKLRWLKERFPSFAGKVTEFQCVLEAKLLCFEGGVTVFWRRSYCVLEEELLCFGGEVTTLLRVYTAGVCVELGLILGCVYFHQLPQ